MQRTGTGRSPAARVDIGTAQFADSRDENME
jgi:hypothetical protein